jgi:ribokinase
MYDVISIGSATIDAFAQTDKKFLNKGRFSFPVGAKLLIRNLDLHIGGGGTNTSVGFSRMGLKTAYVGKMGKGENSDRIVNFLKKEKIDTSLVCREHGRTGFSVVLDAKGSDRTILVFKGSNDNLCYNDIKLKRVKTKWIYSSSMVGKSFYGLERIIKWAHKNKIKVAFNPSSYQCKKGIKFLREILKKLDVLILNDEEARLLVRKKEIKDLLISLQKFGPKIVVITQGAKGAYCFDGWKFYYTKPHNIKIVETTGAGDAFGCGFVTGMIKKGDVKFALKLGVTNAESVIRHVGAKNKLLRFNEALEIIRKRPVNIKIFK